MYHNLKVAVAYTVLFLEDGKDRRCYYTEDDDTEDVTLQHLKELSLMDPQVTKKIATASSNTGSNKKRKQRDQRRAVALAKIRRLEN